MLQTLRNAFKVPEIRKKLLFVLMILVLYRIGAVMPVPFVNSALMNASLNAQLGEGSIFGYLNALSGGAFGQATLFALSVSPYITASIVLQLLDVAFPKWFGGKDGNTDPQEKQKKMTVWTRIVTVALAIMTSYGYYNIMRSYESQGYKILTDDGKSTLGMIVIMVCYCAGAAIIMWLAEKIEEKGIGNGISLILMANILASLAGKINSFISFITTGFSSGVGYGILNTALTILSLAITLAIVVFMIWITGSERRIPIKYAKRVVGRKMYGGQSSYLPLKVNMSGVMPVIFASSIISLPATVIALVPGWSSSAAGTFIRGMFSPTGSWWSLFYMALLFLLILGFSYFYITISFDPVEVSNNLQKQGGQIPGIRQGTPTAEYIKKILSKVTLMGAFFLSFIAIFPDLVSWAVGMLGGTFPSLAFGGTSLLIVIGVIQETAREIEAQLTMRNYKGFLN